MPALAVTEHGNLFSSVIFHDHARQHGVKPILGAENFFLEMQWHGIDEQRIVNGGIPAMARDLGLGLVCTNDVHYLRDSDAHPHDILLCIGTGKAFSDPKRLRYEARQFFLKSAAEMAAAFSDRPEALANTVRIAERCNVELPTGENYLPNFDVPAGFTLDDYFEHVVRQGFAERRARLEQLRQAGAVRNPIDDYDRRLAYEIEMVKRMKYPR